jgi:Sec-independent protein translocase protein TatA
MKKITYYGFILGLGLISSHSFGQEKLPTTARPEMKATEMKKEPAKAQNPVEPADKVQEKNAVNHQEENSYSDAQKVEEKNKNHEMKQMPNSSAEQKTPAPAGKITPIEPKKISPAAKPIPPGKN